MGDKKGWDDSLISLGLGALVVVVAGILLYNFFSASSKDLLNDLANSNRQQTSSTSTEEVPSSITPLSTPEEQLVVIITPLPEETVPPTVQPSTTAKPVAISTPSAGPTQIALATSSPVATAQVAQASSLPEPTAVAQVSTAPVTSSMEGTVKDKYTVVRGDSWWKIAEKFYGTGYEWQTIAKANGMLGKPLNAGTEITIARKGLASSTSTVADASEQPAATSLTGTQTQPAIGGADNAQLPAYSVVRGDNLAKIALSQCGAQSSWEEIAKINKLQNPSVIHAGNVLRISCKL